MTLHPRVEKEETNWDLIAPRGSLLEWIDRFYTRPPGQLDRRLGKLANILTGLQVFADVRSHVHVKAFGIRASSFPRRHGDFDDGPFWRDEYWATDGPDLWFKDGNGTDVRCVSALSADGSTRRP